MCRPTVPFFTPHQIPDPPKPFHAHALQKTLLHSYTGEVGAEMSIIVPVDLSNVASLLPKGYEAALASNFSMGRSDQSLLAFVNFRNQGMWVGACR